MELSALWAIFSYKTLVHGLSGATGMVVAITVFFPLDTVRARLQVDDKIKARFSVVVAWEIYKEEGLAGIFLGYIPNLTTIGICYFIYFYIFQGLKMLTQSAGGEQDAFKDLIFAYIAGSLNVLITAPLWTVNVRLRLQGAKVKAEALRDRKIQKYNGMIDGLYKIFTTEGAGVLWSGTLPSLVLVINPAIQFMVYEALKRYLMLYSGTEELSGMSYFIMGAISKIISTLLTYPMQVVQSRLRVGYSKSQGSTTIVGTLSDLFRTQGVRGLYKGLEAKLLQTVLTAALMFVTYEKINHFVFNLMGEEIKPKKT